MIILRKIKLKQREKREEGKDLGVGFPSRSLDEHFDYF